jgi:hypothetical protein
MRKSFSAAMVCVLVVIALAGAAHAEPRPSPWTSRRFRAGFALEMAGLATDIAGVTILGTLWGRERDAQRDAFSEAAWRLHADAATRYDVAGGVVLGVGTAMLVAGAVFALTTIRRERLFGARTRSLLQGRF